jgi:hypothetical protein
MCRLLFQTVRLTVVAGTVKEIPTSGGVQVEEDTWHNNDLLLQTGLEEVQTVGDGAWQTLEIEPDVEGAVRHVLDHETHFTETLDDIVALVAEMSLQRNHFLLHKGGLEHGNGGLLKGSVGATIEVGTAGTDTDFMVSFVRLKSLEYCNSRAAMGARDNSRLDELFGTQNPCDTPARQTESLGKTIDN